MNDLINSAVLNQEVKITIANMLELSRLVSELDGTNDVQIRNECAEQAHSLIEAALGKHADLSYVADTQAGSHQAPAAICMGRNMLGQVMHEFVAVISTAALVGTIAFNVPYDGIFKPSDKMLNHVKSRMA